MSVEVFIDSNILIYAHDVDAGQKKQTAQVLFPGPSRSITSKWSGSMGCATREHGRQLIDFGLAMKLERPTCIFGQTCQARP